MKTSEQISANQRIRQSRKRSHLLKKPEFKLIEFLCERMPGWVSPDMLTFTGLLGSIIVGAALVMGVYNPYWLILGIIGLAIQWFGDSLDGRIAYYRNTPRKWYGWSLDINVDWVSISLISLGFYFYLPAYKILAILFALAYGGAMVLALMKYQVTGKYEIDKGWVGPTEMRVLVAIVLVIEIFQPGILTIFMVIASIVIMIGNVLDSIQVSRAGDQRDINEKRMKALIENAA